MRTSGTKMQGKVQTAHNFIKSVKKRSPPSQLRAYTRTGSKSIHTVPQPQYIENMVVKVGYISYYEHHDEKTTEEVHTSPTAAIGTA